MHNKKNMMTKNKLPSLVMLMVMAMFRCNMARITQFGRSRATLDATGRRHRVSIYPVLPRRTPWSSILASKIELWCCEIAFRS